MLNRRHFVSTGSGFAALAAFGCAPRYTGPHPVPDNTLAQKFGPLWPDPGGLIDLPSGFSYRVISQLDDRMDDGNTVPDRADGMGSFALPGGQIALVRNHELKADHDAGGTLARGYDSIDGAVLAGGTTTLWLDPETLNVERQFRSLSGTIRNCAGGVTPWGSWLSCEEDTTLAGEGPGDGARRDHGWIFEVPAAAAGPVDPVPLKAMGRFNHEAAAVDPATGIVYLTEDRWDSLLYRFLPDEPGQLAKGGRLQALVIDGLPDTRNWESAVLAVGAPYTVRWIDMDDVASPGDDLRERGAAAGASLFARGEGIWMGDGEMYFTCTNGGPDRLGQIFRLEPRALGDRLTLFFQSNDPAALNYGDNITVTPSGELIVCEDQYTDETDNHLRWIDSAGRSSPLARLRIQTEWAGACFAPDGRTLFVNIYSPAKTIAITGPFAA